MKSALIHLDTLYVFQKRRKHLIDLNCCCCYRSTEGLISVIVAISVEAKGRTTRCNRVYFVEYLHENKTGYSTDKDTELDLPRIDSTGPTPYFPFCIWLKSRQGSALDRIPFLRKLAYVSVTLQIRYRFKNFKCYVNYDHLTGNDMKIFVCVIFENP